MPDGQICRCFGQRVKVIERCTYRSHADCALGTYGNIWPDRDESTGAAIEAVRTAQTEQGRNRAFGP